MHSIKNMNIRELEQNPSVINKLIFKFIFGKELIVSHNLKNFKLKINKLPAPGCSARHQGCLIQNASLFRFSVFRFPPKRDRLRFNRY